MAIYNRRQFLQGSCAGFLGTAAAMSALSANTASAATTSGYKAMVCLFIKGGMDGFDVIMPYDEPSHTDFLNIRPGVANSHTGATARSRETLLELTPSNASSFGGRQFALSPEIAEIHAMFEAGDAAIVGNVGPLIVPTTRTGMDSGIHAVPDKLFSHNDQQSTWMSFGIEGVREGWGGLFGDCVVDSANRPEFTALASSSVDVFLSGKRTRPFRMPGNIESLDIDIFTRRGRTSSGHGDEARAKLEAYLLSNPSDANRLFGRDVGTKRARGIRQQREFVDAFASRTLLTSEFPDTKLGRQMRSIANSIHIQSSFGNNRQIFYATIGGFDTHDGQVAKLPGLMTEISQALAAFKTAMDEAGRWNDVTVFTMSDFGRTLTDNGDGTDHGWGGHHFVLGGSVLGGRIYGGMPELDPDSESFTNSRARLIPDVSVDQYANTLGSWFGLDTAELDNALPNIDRFDQRDLGFFGSAFS